MAMATCSKCGDEFSEKRKELGYDTCLDCGEELAQVEIDKKRERIGIAYNKGSYQYITSKKMVNDLGK